MQKRIETNLWLLVALMNDNWKLLSFLIRLSKSSNQFCHICSIEIMLVCLSILSPVFFIFVFIHVKSSKNDHLGFLCAFNSSNRGAWKHYTACTLKLRPVKLLFVIFGRLSYSFFVNLMVWGNGRLSYLILKNHLFFIEKWPIFGRFFARDGSNGLLKDFLPIRSTKDCIYNFRKTYFRKNERSKQ